MSLRRPRWLVTDLTTDQVAGAVQTATADDVKNSGALELGDLMNRRLNGVYLNEMQANPFQPDVSFRGYTASPFSGRPRASRSTLTESAKISRSAMS